LPRYYGAASNEVYTKYAALPILANSESGTPLVLTPILA